MDLEERDFENIQTMVDKALVLENRREILSILCLLDLSFAPSLKVFNRCLNLLHKDLLPHSGR
jgi:hypothetical protein